MIIHCPTCSRSSDTTRFIGDFCEVCTIDRLKKGLPDHVTIQRCQRCGGIRVKGQYRHMGISSLGELIGSELHMPDCKARVVSYHGNSAMVEFVFDVDGDFVKFERVLGIKAVRRMCQRCYRISSGYYEAIVQLRGDAQGRVANTMDRLTEFMTRGGGFIAKTERVQDGFDVYVSDKKQVQEFFLQKRLKTQISSKLSGIKNGKRVYRNTYLLRL